MIKELYNKWKFILADAKSIDLYFENLEKEVLGKDLENIKVYQNELKEKQKSISLIKNNISKIEPLIVKYTNDLSSLLEIYI
ncbi:MAG: hypothetical protein B6I29_02205 [Marinitoga sp. 4572_148]|nr:MAG: hypothetical protein B6I29_02205 [Marinitoga sp. 4572_148]